MRNLHYKTFGYRLNDKTADEIKTIKEQIGVSYNLLFAEFLKSYKKSKKCGAKKSVKGGGAPIS